MKRTIIILGFILSSVLVFGQYSQYQIGDTAKPEYPYRFPILGAAAFEKGFDIPLPAGIMVNYFFGVQDILIPDISVGFADGLLPDIPLTDVTRLIEFEEVKAAVHSINVRPDLWLFPFLNVYGIFGKTYATTSVKLSYPFELKAVAELEGTSYGIGTTGAFGLGKYFVVLDGNWVWSNMSNFEDPVRSSTFSQRIGRAFPIGKNPESNVAFWVGGMRIRMGGVTEGTIQLKDIISQETFDRGDEIAQNYQNWYNDIDPLKQQLADRVLTPIVNGIENANGDGTISYKLSKEPKQEWNVIVGGQYQINKIWQIRSEGGIIGNRTSFLLSVNYRFGI
jgi:hypothetical protein